MRKFFRVLVACLSFSFVFMACSDDDNKTGKEDLTPDENKAQLEQIGLNLLSKINPADHKDLIIALDRLDEIAYSDDYNEPIHGTLQAAKNVFAKGELSEAMSMMALNSDIIRASQYYGNYTYNEITREWDEAENSEALEIRYKCDGKDVLIKVNASGKAMEYDLEDGSTLEVPEQVVLKMTVGGTELLGMTLDVTSKGENNVAVALEMSASGYGCSAKVDLTSAATASVKLTKGSETLIDANLNADVDKNKLQDESVDAAQAFGKASFKINVLNEMNVVGNCTSVKDLALALERLSGDDESNEYCKQAADLCNKYITMEMRYEGGKDVIATVEMQPYVYDSWNSEEYWDIEPVIVFTVDDSRHSFEEYFDEVGFSDLITKGDALLEQYKQFVR